MWGGGFGHGANRVSIQERTVDHVNYMSGKVEAPHRKSKAAKER